MLSSLTGMFSRGGAETAPPPRAVDFSHEELMKPWESQEARDAYPLGLLAACVARTAELGFEGMQKHSGRDRDRADFRCCYEEAVGVAVEALPRMLEADDQYRGLIDRPNFLRRSWRPSPIFSDMSSLLGTPSFSDAPSVGEKIAWDRFHHSFTMAYMARVTQILRGEVRDNARRLAAKIEEKAAELKEELRERLAGGVDSLTLASLKKDCEDFGLAVSGTKGKLFERLQGFLDGTVQRKKRRRR